MQIAHQLGMLIQIDGYAANDPGAFGAPGYPSLADKLKIRGQSWITLCQSDVLSLIWAIIRVVLDKSSHNECRYHDYRNYRTRSQPTWSNPISYSV
ncbi:MAG TPA: hypothetical protein VFZ76_09350 [Anaerolineales bacterium]